MHTEFIIKIIDKQYAANMERNLFYEAEKGYSNLEPAEETLEFILDNRYELGEFLKEIIEADNCESLSDYMADRTCEIFIGINQFLDFNNSEKSGLKEIYVELIKDIYMLCGKVSVAVGDIHGVFKKHTLRMIVYLQKTNGVEIFEKYRKEKKFQEVVCRNYSDAFQTTLLGLSLENMIEPVLDIGCGKNAELLDFLRRAGIRAEGIDRVKGKKENYFASNWFDVELVPNFWGTIISHMAFSNHFWHHHLRSDGEMLSYSLKYHEILKALKPGGLFIYAPGLPFIEKDLNNKYFSIKRKPIEGISDPDGRFYVSIIKRL